MKKHKSGFTLAEVLITLVIIGIIAAMTIPTLMNKTNEQETVVAVKKAYSTLSQAYQRMIAENGEIYPQNLGASTEDATETFGNMFSKQLSVQKNCGIESGGDCWSTQNRGMYKFMDGSDWYNYNENPYKYYLLKLNNGTSVKISVTTDYHSYGTSESLMSAYGTINIDVNGDKEPNTAGRDVFIFYITKYGVIPFGTPDDTNKSLSACKTDGRGCTAWVVTKGNMDYLRKDVSW